MSTSNTCLCWNPLSKGVFYDWSFALSYLLAVLTHLYIFWHCCLFYTLLLCVANLWLVWYTFAMSSRTVLVYSTQTSSVEQKTIKRLLGAQYSYCIHLTDASTLFQLTWVGSAPGELFENHRLSSRALLSHMSWLHSKTLLDFTGHFGKAF